ncbi:glycosyltransferase [Priestia flexa]|uniref:glycosyltransferase n=1 Tax=Priestia flexa TaxID=86664 RepID=UPI0032EF6FCE
MSFIVVMLLLTSLLITRIPTFHHVRFQKPSSIETRKVSVIIPARNEEHNIKKLLSTLNDNRSNLYEIIVVDDGSTDQTAHIAAEMGATVLKPKKLPKGWLGKSWACWNGAKKANGSILLFLDADTWVEKGGIKRIHDVFELKKGFLSIHPYHGVKKPYESLSAFFHYIVFASVGGFHLFNQNGTASGGFGQCLVCEKSEYFRYGGHQAICGEVVENMAFANYVREQQGEVYCMGGRGAVSMRMYPNGISELIRGWSKSFVSGAGKTEPIYLFFVSLWLTGMIHYVFSLPLLIQQYPILAGTSYVLMGIMLFSKLRHIGAFSYVTSFLFPIHLFFFLIVFACSLLQTTVLRKVTWKGRKIQVDHAKKRFFK